MSEGEAGEEEGPPLRLVIRSKAEGVEILGLSSEREEAKATEICSGRKQSILAVSCGGHIAVNGSGGGIEIINGIDGSRIAELPEETSIIEKFEFSPKGTYLITWQKADPKNLPDGSLRIWKGGDLVRSIHSKQLKSIGSTLAWSGDEKVCFHRVTNTVHIQDGEDGRQINSIRAPDLSQISVCQGEHCPPPYPIACFVPELKGKPAQVSLFATPTKIEKPILSKSFYRAQDISIEWSPMGHGVLVQAHTDVDATGTSYYGGTSLYLLTSSETSGSDNECSQIQLPKEGPVADAKWEPSKGREFIVIAGTVPAVAAIYDLKASQLFNFGAAHRNSIAWAPHGRFLALCGFGNLAGDVDFWDRNKKKKLNSINIPCAVTYGWSPDSRHFMTATLAPRMNVDNCVRIYRYDGTGPIIHKTDREPLFECAWLPLSASLYPDRGVSPGAKQRLRDQKTSAQDTTQVGGVTPVSQAYVPPGARASSGGSSLAAQIRAQRQAELGKSAANASRSGPKSIPGAPPPPDASRNKKRRDAAKKRKEAADAAAVLDKALKEPSPPPPPSKSDTTEVLSKEDLLKRQKALKKKIKQITELQEKVAAGLKPSADQTEKLSRADALQTELADLESKLSSFNS